MADLEPTDAVWLKSKQSADGACVEVAFVGASVLVRDSKDPSGPRLSFTGPEWAAFLAGARDGTFDPPDCPA
ncbi:MAG TPA: DUF397 domain-containing protein [Streptosporangiaceae bacterium]|nr:DUF397 domain-containing protein [Streptosporangiaceae bacterium]